jgi:hypothetical protein
MLVLAGMAYGTESHQISGTNHVKVRSITQDFDAEKSSVPFGLIATRLIAKPSQIERSAAL